MSGGEIALMLFIIAAFTAFGVTLAWVSHGDATERPAVRRHAANDRSASPANSYQGADG